MAFEVFISYSHKDRKFRDELATHLSNLRNQGVISDWFDGDIPPGTEWKPQIMNHLQTAQIILLLVSPSFLASKYCYGSEMMRALERHKEGTARVIPIILRPVYWQGILGKLQALPTDAKPVTDPNWHDLDRAFFNVTEEIRKIVIKMETKSFADASEPKYAQGFLNKTISSTTSTRATKDEVSQNLNRPVQGELETGDKKRISLLKN